MRPAYGVHVDPVLPTKCKWTDGTFSDIIVHWDSTIGKKDAQELFLIDAVLKTLVGVASDRNFRHGIFHPRKESINLGLDDELTMYFAFFYCAVTALVI